MTKLVKTETLDSMKKESIIKPKEAINESKTDSSFAVSLGVTIMCLIILYFFCKLLFIPRKSKNRNSVSKNNENSDLNNKNERLNDSELKANLKKLDDYYQNQMESLIKYYLYCNLIGNEELQNLAEKKHGLLKTKPEGSIFDLFDVSSEKLDFICTSFINQKNLAVPVKVKKRPSDNKLKYILETNAESEAKKLANQLKETEA